jgi:acyl carrier protein
MDIERRIREYVTRELLYDRDLVELGDEQSLLAPGLLDSVAILRLVAWIEDEFGFTLLDDDVVPENLETIRRLADLVRRKQAAAQV